MTLLGTTEEVAADVVAKWDELSRVPLAATSAQNPDGSETPQLIVIATCLTRSRRPTTSRPSPASRFPTTAWSAARCPATTTALPHSRRTTTLTGAGTASAAAAAATSTHSAPSYGA